MTVARLRTALGTRPADLSALAGPKKNGPLQWVQASCADQLRFIGINEVQCFRADDKYTCVQTADGEHLIRTPIAELLAQLDLAQFWQIHRSTIVNLRHVERAEGAAGGRLVLPLRLG